MNPHDMILDTTRDRAAVLAGRMIHAAEQIKRDLDRLIASLANGETVNPGGVIQLAGPRLDAQCAELAVLREVISNMEWAADATKATGATADAS